MALRADIFIALRANGVSANEMDETLDKFREDARRLGIPIGEYERRFGIILDDPGIVSPATQRIRRHEVPAGLLSPDDLALVEAREKRRRDRTR